MTTNPDTGRRSHELVGDHATWRAMRIVRRADQLIALHETQMCRHGVADVRQVRSLAKWLTAATDQVQLAVCGTVNRKSWSHRTCLDGVLAALHAHPVPWDSGGDTRRQWLEVLVDRAADLVQVAADLEQHHRDTVQRQGR